MDIDVRGLKNATKALENMLSAEASAQNAYLFKFADGRVSLELEWLDIQGLAKEVIAAYMADVGPSTPRV